MAEEKELVKLFKKLNLKAFAESYDVIAQKNESLQETLVQLCNLELDCRYSAKVKRRINHANFPKTKTIAMLDYKITPRLPRNTVDELATCKFIENKQNVVLVGDSGGGKTHLGIALGIEACKKNYSVKYFTIAQLVNILLKEKKEGDIEKFMSKVIRKYDLIIIDEVGFVDITKEGAQLLFQVFSDRDEKGSIIVTSNLVNLAVFFKVNFFYAAFFFFLVDFEFSDCASNMRQVKKNFKVKILQCWPGDIL